MKSLKQLKEALNKMPDDELDNMFITHGMWIEDPESTLGVYWCDEDTKAHAYNNIYEMPEYEVLKQFVRDLNSDSKKCIIGMLDEEMIDQQYCDDVPEKD